MSTISRARETLIQEVTDALVWTTRQHRLPLKPRKRDHIRIRRGVYLKKSLLTSTHQLWEKQMRVFIAQCIVACQLAPQTSALTHESALYFLDIPTVEAPPVISMTYGTKRWRLRTPFPPVYCDGERISKLRPVRYYHDTHSHHYPIGPARVVNAQTALIDLSLQGRQRPAFAAANILLRTLTLKLFRNPHTLDVDSASIKEQLIAKLPEKHCRTSKHKATAFLQSLDPQVESIAEGCLLWDLHATQVKPWKTQFELGKYRADFCVPEENVILEVEGASKLGTAVEERNRNAAALINRSSTLTQMGFHVFALAAADILYTPERVIAALRAQAPHIFNPHQRPPRWCQTNSSRKNRPTRRSTPPIKATPVTV